MAEEKKKSWANLDADGKTPEVLESEYSVEELLLGGIKQLVELSVQQLEYLKSIDRTIKGDDIVTKDISSKSEKSKITDSAWRPTKKNPTIEWCPEAEASPEDIEQAQNKKGGMWVLRGDRGLSLFRKAK